MPGNTSTPTPVPASMRQRQADEQQAARPAELVAQRAQVEPRGVAEEQQDERDLGDALGDGALHGDVEQAEHRRADEEAGDHEDDRRGDPAPVERPGERAPDDDDDDDGRRCYHATPASRSPAAAPGGPRQSYSRRSTRGALGGGRPHKAPERRSLTVNGDAPFCRVPTVRLVVRRAVLGRKRAIAPKCERHRAGSEPVVTCRARRDGAPRRYGAPRRHLPSWNDGPASAAILEFVRSVTAAGRVVRPCRRSASPPSTTTARSGARSPCTSRPTSSSVAGRRWSGRTRQRRRAALQGARRGRPRVARGRLRTRAGADQGRRPRPTRASPRRPSRRPRASSSPPPHIRPSACRTPRSRTGRCAS